MQVHNPLVTGNQTAASKKSSREKVKKSLFSLFDKELTIHEHSAESQDDDMDELRKEIDLLGDKLEIEPTLPNFSNFRDSLSRLAKKINSEAYRLDKFGGTAQNPRYYEIITVINREADRLYELVMQEQKNHLAITAKVIGIKGLVVDLIG